MIRDDVDRRILNALLDDGRADVRAISGATGIEPATVAQRLERLEGEGIVEEYVPVVDYDSLGYDLTAVIRLSVAGDAIPSVVEELCETNRLVTVYEVTGAHDVVAIGRFRDTDEMNALIADIVAIADVRETTSSVVLDVVRDFEQFHLDRSED